jgi:NTE family protein
MDRGLMPRWEISPDSPFSKAMFSTVTAQLPRRNFYDFTRLLQSHIDFEEIKSWGKQATPALLIGAANILKGEFKKFSSIKGEIQVEAILASAAVPEIFPAVEIGENAYWDGLFSDNPPTDELLDSELVGIDNIPDELWIIQINPKTCKSIPTSPQDIIDRRNEMIGNESLFQDLEKIELINRFLEKGAFTKEFLAKYRPIKIHIIEMSHDLQERLDYASKLNRDSKFINSLIEDGEKQGKKFLKSIS